MFLLIREYAHAAPCSVHEIHVFQIRLTSQIEELDFFWEFDNEFTFLRRVKVKAPKKNGPLKDMASDPRRRV